MSQKKTTSKRYNLIFILQCILLIVSYTIYANKFVEPSIFPYFGIIALIFPVLFIVQTVLFFIGLFWFRKKRNVFILLALVPLVFSFFTIYKVPIFNSQKPESKGVKILSFNVQYAYQGINHLEEYIEKKDPDIVFLQEIYKRHWRKEALLPNHYTAVYDFVGISSKHPIIFDKKITLNNTNGYACMADVVIHKDTIRVFNIYLEPIYLSKELIHINDSDELEENSIIVKNKLVKGYRTHQYQLKIIKQFISESPYPVIVSGDFNSVPNSYEYYTITEHLTDSFIESGSGLGTTFHDYHYPIRIDYILHDEHFISTYYQVDRSFKFSDHFPVLSTLQFRE